MIKWSRGVRRIVTRAARSRSTGPSAKASRQGGPRDSYISSVEAEVLLDAGHPDAERPGSPGHRAACFGPGDCARGHTPVAAQPAGSALGRQRPRSRHRWRSQGSESATRKECGRRSTERRDPSSRSSSAAGHSRPDGADCAADHLSAAADLLESPKQTDGADLAEVIARESR